MSIVDSIFMRMFGRPQGMLGRFGGRIALGFTPNLGQSSNGLTEMLTTAGFTEVQLVETKRGFCALAIAS